MQIGRITGATRIVGKQQGFLGLPIRDEVVNCPIAGPNFPVMVTAWLPTPKELDAINAGAAVHVRIYGSLPSPMTVEVGEPPSEAVPGGGTGG